MARRHLVAIVFVTAATASAHASASQHTPPVGSRLSALHGQIAEAQSHEQALSGEIATVTEQIRTLEARVGDVSTRLSTLQADLALQRSRLSKIQALLDLQSFQLSFYKRQSRVALERVRTLLVLRYTHGDPTALDIILSASSLRDLLDRLDYTAAIARADKTIVIQFRVARRRTQLARLRSRSMKARLSATARVIGYRVQQMATLRDQLLADTHTAAMTLGQKQSDLVSTRQKEQEWVSEARALSAVSSQLAATIQVSQATPAPTSPSSGGGLAWPVNGPITSPFGMRWGTLHPGLDIGAGMGTPIRAAGSGRVIVAGYEGGYGNLVVIDHGNGIATAYGHQSSIAVAVGQDVTKGQVIGYVGSTGFSTGPHLHFQVRVDGSPVDPLGYL